MAHYSFGLRKSIVASMTVALSMATVAVPSTIVAPIAVAQSPDLYLKEVETSNGVVTLTMSDNTTHTINFGSTMSSIEKNGDTLVITKADGTSEEVDVSSGITAEVQGSGKDRVLILKNKNGDVIGAPLDMADVHISNVKKNKDGNYDIYLNTDPDTPFRTITVGDDITAEVEKLTQTISEKGDNDASNIGEIRKSLVEKIVQSDSENKELLRLLNDKYKFETDRLNQRIDELQKCVISPHIALPALIPSVALFAALAQQVQIPGIDVNFGKGNPQMEQMMKMAYDARGLVAAGIGLAGLVGLFFVPGLCGSGSLADQLGEKDADINRIFGSSKKDDTTTTDVDKGSSNEGSSSEEEGKSNGSSSEEETTTPGTTTPVPTTPESTITPEPASDVPTPNTTPEPIS